MAPMVAAAPSLPALPDRFVPRRIIGSGAMGVVVEAWDRKDERTVAVKTIWPELWLDPQRRERMRREAALLAAIPPHPNVAILFGREEFEGRLLLVMEFVDGPSLRERLFTGTLDPPTAIDVAAAIAEGLRAAHRRGIIHRDVKPDNIRFTSDGVAKVVDFGLGCWNPDAGAVPGDEPASRLSNPGFFLGTVGYVSPEQACGEPVTPVADVFSFGCVVFQCLAGNPPFFDAAGRWRQALLAGAVEWDRLPPSAVAVFRPLLERCLDKSPSLRPQSFAEVLEALNDCRRRLRGSESPTAITAAPATHNLPLALTSFVGRRDEFATLERLTAESRLISIVGFPGTGKSRLAAEAVRRMIDRGTCPAREVRLVNLGAAKSAASLPSLIAKAVGAKEKSGGGLADAIVREVGRRDLLLILDNIPDVLIDACREFDTRMLAAGLSLRILATAPRPLGVPGERVFPLGPLTCEVAGSRFGQPTYESGVASTGDAERLFLDRARLSWPDFSESPESLGSVATICRLVGGLPLAIELAASMLQALSLDDLRRLIEESPLTLGAPMESIVRCSVDRLSPAGRELLRSLCALPTDWSFEAIEAAAPRPGSGSTLPDVRAVRAAFLEIQGRSLVMRSPPPGWSTDTRPRYRPPEVLRAEVLRGVDPDADPDLLSLRRRHLRHLVEMFERETKRFDGPGQKEAFDKLQSEHESMLCAIDAAVRFEPDGGVLAERLAVATTPLWYRLSMPSEAVHWLGKAISRREAASRDHPATPFPDSSHARALTRLGVCRWMRRELVEAERLCRAGWRAARKAGDTKERATALQNLALVLTDLERYERAKVAYRGAIRLYGQIGDAAAAARARGNLAMLLARRGRFDEAEPLVRLNIESFERAGDDLRRGNSMVLLADICRKQRRLAEAPQHAAEALRLAHGCGHWPGVLNALEVGGLAAWEGGQHGVARLTLANAQSLREGGIISLGPEPRSRQLLEAHLALGLLPDEQTKGRSHSVSIDAAMLAAELLTAARASGASAQSARE